MRARGFLLVRAFMKDPVITKDLTRSREQAVPSLSGETHSCGGKMLDVEEVGSFLWTENVKVG